MLTVTAGLVPFWDDSLIDRGRTDAVLSVNRPTKADVVMTFDRPWDGNADNFFSIVRDDGFYRMYYEAWSFFDPTYTEGISVCYAESRDGLRWERPSLGLCAFRGSTDNNIIMRGIQDNIVVMKDENPACPPQHRYKAIMSEYDASGFRGYDPAKQSHRSLVCRVSSDGIRFTDYCVISQGYGYDSQNTVHWDPHRKKYYCYFRDVHKKIGALDPALNEEDVRGIMVTESEDFLHWSEPVRLRFNRDEDYPLYTNCVTAYPYDTRYYVGFPTRYVERKEWTKNYDRLCGADRRRHRMEKDARFGLTVTDCIFMSSRDHVNWYRFDEACLTPGPEYAGNWVYGDCYPAVGGLLETPGRFAGDPPELSMYAKSHHRMPEKGELRRYVWRRDGFASVKATYEPQTLRTKPFVLDAETLKLNFRTSARGGMVLRILDGDGSPIPGYETCELFGDAEERIVDFDAPLSALRGRAVCFDFTMRDAEIFAMRFE